MESLTVPGTLDALEAIAHYTIAAAKAAGLEKKSTYNLRLAVDEIVTNIIIHGYQEANRTGTIRLQAKLDDLALIIAIEDSGVPYDPTQTPLPHDLNCPPEQRQVGGLGIYLALQGVDRFFYERVDDRNRNVLVINRLGIQEQ